MINCPEIISCRKPSQRLHRITLETYISTTSQIHNRSWQFSRDIHQDTSSASPPRQSQDPARNLHDPSADDHLLLAELFPSSCTWDHKHEWTKFHPNILPQASRFWLPLEGKHLDYRMFPGEHPLVSHRAMQVFERPYLNVYRDERAWSVPKEAKDLDNVLQWIPCLEERPLKEWVTRCTAREMGWLGAIYRIRRYWAEPFHDWHIGQSKRQDTNEWMRFCNEVTPS